MDLEPRDRFRRSRDRRTNDQHPAGFVATILFRLTHSLFARVAIAYLSQRGRDLIWRDVLIEHCDSSERVAIARDRSDRI